MKFLKRVYFIFQPRFFQQLQLITNCLSPSLSLSLSLSLPVSVQHAAAKTVSTHKTYVQRPQVQEHVIAPQAQNNVVGGALEVSIVQLFYLLHFD